MTYEDISPRYMMKLISEVEQALWDEFETSRYKNVGLYIEKWHKSEGTPPNYNDYEENFEIYWQDEHRTKIDLFTTLHRMPKEIVIRIATDLGVPTPGFLPVVPEKFKNVLTEINQNACHNFERAIRNVYENPDESVTLAASALDGTIRTILEHEKLQELKAEVSGKSLSKQAQLITKRLSEMSNTKCPQEIITLCSQLRSIGQTIDDLRSDKATAHGKLGEEYVVDEPLWAALAVNTCATVGIFLWELFNNKYKLVEVVSKDTTSGLPEESINLDEIPF